MTPKAEVIGKTMLKEGGYLDEVLTKEQKLLISSWIAEPEPSWALNK